MKFLKAVINFPIELFSWAKLLLLMFFQKNFYLYMWSIAKDLKNMYYRYKV